MFSAPLSAYHAGAALAAFKKVEQSPELVEKLHKNVDYFRDQIEKIAWCKDMNPLMRAEVYGTRG